MIYAATFIQNYEIRIRIMKVALLENHGFTPIGALTSYFIYQMRIRVKMRIYLLQFTRKK